ncbi:MAG: ribosome silencing factor [Candidatus Omnitrophica bacterium]|nr:ribosome silencing factor [Candidatus Omnitrophota bacterium]
MLAARAALAKQAEDVVVLDLRTLSTVTDFFILCTAGSARQLEALKDHIEGELARQGCAVRHIEGAASAGGLPSTAEPDLRWVLMDCGDIVVHLLDQPTRAFYRLEDLWADARRLPLPQAL